MPTTKSWPSTTFRREAIGRFPRVRGWFRDLLDVEILNSTLSEGFDGVLHLATLSLVGEAVESLGALLPDQRLRHVEPAGRDARGQSVPPDLQFDGRRLRPARGGPVEKTAPTRSTNRYGSSKLAADAMIGYEAAAGPAGSTTRTPRS